MIKKEIVQPKMVAEKKIFSILLKAPENAKIARFYGFLPIETVKSAKNQKELREILIKEISEQKNGQNRENLLFWTKNPDTKFSVNRIDCTLSVFGSNKSVSEMLLLQAGKAILENAGWKNISVKINSVGNKESVADFERRTSAFLRKHFNEFPAELRQLVKKDPFSLIRTKEDKYKEWREASPQSIDSLSEESRAHFKEILEFLETLEIPYEIDCGILGDFSMATDTVFEIISENGEVLAEGMRYNRLSKKMQLKRELPAVELVIKAKALKPQTLGPIKEAKPKFYLIQFGPEAKQKSFAVLEKLQKSNLLAIHSLLRDKLTGQMQSAEEKGVPYILLLGQKEALENSVVVRNTVNRSQSTVLISELMPFLKKNLL